MLHSAVSVLVVAQSSSEIPEGLMNNPVLTVHKHQNSLNCLSTRMHESNDMTDIAQLAIHVFIRAITFMKTLRVYEARTAL